MNNIIHNIAAVAVMCAAINVFADSYLKLDCDFSQDATEVAPEIAASPLFHKKIAFLGDSYVQNHHGAITNTWHCLLAEKYRMHYLNFGRNGNRIVFSHPREGTVMLKRFDEIPEDADYIVIIAGHNDANAIRTLNKSNTKGMPEDELKAKQLALLQQFKEGFANFLSALKARYPNARIAFVTPWAVDLQYFDEVIETIKADTATAGIPCCESSKISGINPNDPEVRKALFQSPRDNAHLNPAGHKLMLEKVEPFFRSL